MSMGGNRSVHDEEISLVQTKTGVRELAGTENGRKKWRIQFLHQLALWTSNSSSFSSAVSCNNVQCQ